MRALRFVALAGLLATAGTAVAAPVTLDVTVNKVGDHPMLRVPAAGFDAVATIKRSDFGVGAYVPNVSDEIKIRITTEAHGDKQ